MTTCFRLIAVFFVLALMGTGSKALWAARLPAFETYFQKSPLGKVTTRESAHFRVSWVHPRDEIIADALLYHLEKAEVDLAPLWKSSSDSRKVPVEIYPDLKTFSEVSGLPLARFKATGTIALTLEQRLMVLSPRNLWNGYPWATTVVHEYIHYLIREISRDYVPIWLHEGTAQIYQGYPYDKSAPLRPSQWGLFKKYREKKKLLTLDALKEPFPMKKDPEEAELAYTQALLFTKWLDSKCGVIPLIRWAEQFKSLDRALEKCAGRTSAELAKDFLPKIMGDIVIPPGADVEFYARDFSSQDPKEVEGKMLDREARNFSQLADRLFDQGRFQASAVEMEKALKKADAAPPSWRRQLALSLDKSGNSKKATAVLQKLLKDYPDDAAGWYLKAQKELAANQWAQAWNSFVRAFFVNPFMEGLAEQMKVIHDKNPDFKYDM